jgi:hypothetical protein
MTSNSSSPLSSFLRCATVGDELTDETMPFLFALFAAATRASREKLGGKFGSNLNVGDCCTSLIRSANCGALGGDDDGEDCGGADIDFRDLRLDVVDALLRGTFGFEMDDRMGEEDSAPDWNLLLSSQPLSSAT